MKHPPAGMRPPTSAVLVLLAALGAFTAQPTQAALFEVDATGTITSINNGPNTVIDPTDVGQAITFHYLFDTSVAGSDNNSNGNLNTLYFPADPTAANYGPTGQFGGYLVAPVVPDQANVAVSIYNAGTSSASEMVSLVGYSLSVNGVGSQGEALLTLQGVTGDAPASAALPSASAFTLANFPSASFYFTPDSNNGADGRSTVSGTVTSLSATDLSAAPEPSECAMLSCLGLGLGGLMLRARKRQAA